MVVTLRPGLTGPLYRQLFETLRGAILDGSLAAPQRLPSSRQLARQLSMSRNTVNACYEMLLAEGYVTSRPGAGYFVSADLPDQPAEEMPRPASHRAQITRRGLSDRGAWLAAASRPVPAVANPAFQTGLPALDQFPFRQWQQHLDRYSRRPPERLLRYQDAGGLAELKSALRDYLQLARGVRCRKEQIIVVAGGQAALDLVARMLVDPGDRVALEEPGYLGARDAFLAAGAKLMPTAVDRDGLRVDALPAGETKLAYVTPSYQFPTGVTLTASRRIQLLQWASRQDAYVVEDDYDSEFRYRGRPLSSLQGLDHQQRVIYVGTFSKVMFPALRLGYLVAPPHLAESFAAALRKTGQDTPLLFQAAMADFIRSGQFASHIRKMRKLYGERQETFVRLAQRHLSPWLSISATEAGMQLAAHFREAMDEAGLQRRAAEQDLVLPLLRRYYLGDCRRPGLLLGYSGIPAASMEPPVRALASILRESGGTAPARRYGAGAPTPSGD